MLNTVIDYSILEHFTKSQPAQIPIGREEDNEYWNSFWKFLKQGSDIVLTNYGNQQNIFLNKLTTGRKGTTIKTEDTFKKPHKCKFPKDQDIQTVFFINEESESDKVKYRKNNGFLFGFRDDYPKVWKELSLFGKPKVLPVRETDEVANFHSWNQLSEYILPFSDLIIVDNYMFDETVWDNNLFKIIEEFSRLANVRFNLLLVSFAHSKYVNVYSGLEQKINDKLKDIGVSCNLSVVLTKERLKEHDRGMFTNYLRIKSGDSLVYFNKNGGFETSGTDIDFHSLSEEDKFNAAYAALVNIKNIIGKLKETCEKDKRLFGDLENRLI